MLLKLLVFLCIVNSALCGCAANETWKYGISESDRCESTCWDREPVRPFRVKSLQVCDNMMKEGACACKEDYVRIGDKCRLPQECTEGDCLENEEIVALGYPFECRTKCWGRNIESEKNCDEELIKHVCNCKKGFVFDDGALKCVPYEQCADLTTEDE